MLTEEFLAELRFRVPFSRVIPFRVVRFKNGEEPQLNVCHMNVEKWIKENPKHTPVRGWLVTSDFLLDAHSVVADEREILFDITPLQTTTRPPFLPLVGSECKVWALHPQIHLVQISN
jgi:hypothetical protein